MSGKKSAAKNITRIQGNNDTVRYMGTDSDYDKQVNDIKLKKSKIEQHNDLSIQEKFIYYLIGLLAIVAVIWFCVFAIIITLRIAMWLW